MKVLTQLQRKDEIFHLVVVLINCISSDPHIGCKWSIWLTYNLQTSSSHEKYRVLVSTMCIPKLLLRAQTSKQGLIRLF